MKYLLLVPLALAAACSHHQQDAAPAAAAGHHGKSAKAEHQTHRFTVRHFEGAQTRPTDEVGILAVGHNGTLTVETAEGINGSKLREAVAKLNNSATVDDVDRKHEGFFDAERAHLRKYYGFELEAL